MENLVRNMSAEQIAKTIIAIEATLNPDTNTQDFITTSKLANQLFDIGAEKDSDWVETYFDAVIAAQ